MRAVWKPRRRRSRWPTTSGPCAAWRWRRSRFPRPVCWSIREWDSPPARWCGWIAAASSLRLPVHRAPGRRRGFRRTGTAPLWRRPDRTAAPPTCGCSMWSPDGSRIAHFGKQGDAYDLFVRAAQVGSKAELLLKSPDRKFPTDWSHDGKYIAYMMDGVGTRLDLWGFSVGDRRVAPILDTVYAEGFATISPDGKWLAYQSDQSGRNEVYVQAFDGLNNGTRRRWTVSKGGGLPRWRSDSGELFFMTTDGRIMSVSIHLGSDGGIESGPPQMLFQTRPVPGSWNLYDVTPDGQRFVFNISLAWTSAPPITVVTNLTEKLKD